MIKVINFSDIVVVYLKLHIWVYISERDQILWITKSKAVIPLKDFPGEIPTSWNLIRLKALRNQSVSRKWRFFAKTLALKHSITDSYIKAIQKEHSHFKNSMKYSR